MTSARPAGGSGRTARVPSCQTSTATAQRRPAGIRKSAERLKRVAGRR